MIGTIVDQVKKLEYFARACKESMLDIADADNGIPIFYNIDFSLLVPTFFDRPGSGSAPFLDSKKDEVHRILNEAGPRSGCQLLVSGPTVIEFFDQLNHLQRRIRGQLPRLRTRYQDNASVLREALKTSAEIRNELSLYTQKGIDQQIAAPIRRFQKLLDEGKLRGIGDVLDVEAVRSKTDKDLCERFVEQHKKRRLEYDTNRGRSPEDSLFHYRMDAVNNCMTLAASKSDHDKRFLFVTPTFLNIEQCTLGEVSYGRLDFTPLFRINLDRLREQREGRFSETEFLFSAAKEAWVLRGELLEEMKRFTKLEDCPPLPSDKSGALLPFPDSRSNTRITGDRSRRGRGGSRGDFNNCKQSRSLERNVRSGH